MTRKMMVFTGNANPELAKKIAAELDLPLSRSEVTRFSDGEIHVELLESVRGRHIVIIQPTSSPTNDHLMELILMADAARRAGAKKITAVVPYYGYSRQDRRSDLSRTPISSRVVANMIEGVGIDQIVTVDIHSLQQVGFFDIPFINISAMVEMTADIFSRYGTHNPMIVSPDIGGVARARAVAKELELDLAIVDKRREKANHSEVMNIIGDVKGRCCIMVDDMVDTAGTLCHSAKALKDHGAICTIAYCTHGILSGTAYETLKANKENLDELVITDTIPLDESQLFGSQVRVVSIAKLIGETLSRIRFKKSLQDILP